MPTTTRDEERAAQRQPPTGSDCWPADASAFERFYRELRAIAEQQLARERRGHTLAPTSLVHEVFVRLHGADLAPGDRLHFLRLAATVMRNVLVDSARRRQRRNHIEPLAAAVANTSPEDARVLRLDDAMRRLGAIDPQLLRVVELRFLVGLGVEETARVLCCSTATVKRDWRTARAFLQREVERADR